MMNNESSSNEEDYFKEFLSLTEFNKKTINDRELKHYIEYFIQLGNIKRIPQTPTRKDITDRNKSRKCHRSLIQSYSNYQDDEDEYEYENRDGYRN